VGDFKRNSWLPHFGDLPDDRHRIVSGYHAKCAFALKENLKFFLDSHPLESFVFETLTFADSPDVRTAQARFASFRRNLLIRGECNWLAILERSARDRLHFHLVTQFPGCDFRTGFDWEHALLYQRATRQKAPLRELKRLSAIFKRSATADLKARWDFLDSKAGKYGFGRTESRPIRSNGAALATYLSKYLCKHVGRRLVEDKRAKLVLYGASVRRNTTCIAWNSPGAKLWRSRIAELSQFLGLPSYTSLFYDFLDEIGDSQPQADRVATADSCAREMSGPQFWLGRSWAWQLYNTLRDTPEFEFYDNPVVSRADDLRAVRPDGGAKAMDARPSRLEDLPGQGLLIEDSSQIPLYGAGAL